MDRIEEAKINIHFALMDGLKAMSSEMDDELADLTIAHILNEIEDMTIRNMILDMKKDNKRSKEIFDALIEAFDSEMKKNFQ